ADHLQAFIFTHRKPMILLAVSRPSEAASSSHCLATSVLISVKKASASVSSTSSSRSPEAMAAAIREPRAILTLHLQRVHLAGFVLMTNRHPRRRVFASSCKSSNLPHG